MGNFGSLKLGGQFMMLSGLLHFLSAAFGDTMIMASIGVLYLLIGAGLTRSMRWLGYFAFLFMIFGAVIAYGFLTTAPAPTWVTWAIIIANVLAALTLFVALWRAPVAKAPTA